MANLSRQNVRVWEHDPVTLSLLAWAREIGENLAKELVEDSGEDLPKRSYKRGQLNIVRELLGWAENTSRKIKE